MWRTGQRRISRRWNFLFGAKTRPLHVEVNAAMPSKSAVALAEVKYKVGDKLHGFTVKRVSSVPELHLAAVQLVHDDTGAEHFHVAREDNNNVFAVAFRTVPMDSSGVAHILEHTTLCGSEKYPCRDPFFKMLTRSLSTYMNAWTFPDFTMYPFATQNAQDFKNLLAVYLDCAFFPTLSEMDFRQEGWRLEPEDLAKPDSQIIFKGVVYNEMKGVFSNAENLFETQLQRSILPSHTYSTSYGGDPPNIPDLTWSQLRDFHSRHYHPSNAKFYTYGNQPLEGHLEAINELALRRFTKVHTSTAIPNETRWSEPQVQEMACPFDPIAADPDKQTTVSVAFLLGSLADMDPAEVFVLNILCSLLIKGPNSPFYKSLIASNIGSDYAPSTGMHGHTKDAYFAVGLQGISRDDVERVRDVIRQTIDQVIEEGFDESRIESVLHSVELSLKHETSNFGLSLVSSLMSMWNHGAEPTSTLQIGDHIARFKENLAFPTYLQDKVKHYLKENQHNVTLIMSPTDDYQVELERKETEKRDTMLSHLSHDQKSRLYADALELLDYQSKQHDSSCLPSLTVADISKEGQTVTMEDLQPMGISLQFCPQPTNNVTYFRALSSITSLNDDLKPYVPLFSFIVTRIGAGNFDYQQMAQEIELRTGGLGVSAHVVSNPSDLNAFEQGVCFSSFCLDRNLPYMFSLWQDIFNSPDFQDVERIRTLVTMLAADMANSVADSGHAYAMSYSSRHLTPAAELAERFSGLQQVAFLKSIADQDDLQPLINKLTQIAVHVLDCTSMRCSINCVPEQADVIGAAMEGFLDGLPKNRDDPDAHVENDDFFRQTVQSHVVMPFNVNYTSKSIQTVPYTHEDSASLRILARLMSTKFLHREIREKGGAYGGGASSGSGVFQYFSYRDPNAVETFDVYNQCVDWAVEGSFADQDVDEAKLSVFSQIDSPVSPGTQGMTRFLKGITDQQQQEHRKRLFETTRQSLIQAAERYLAAGQRPSGETILGPNNEETMYDSRWTVIGEIGGTLESDV